MSFGGLVFFLIFNLFSLVVLQEKENKSEYPEKTVVILSKTKNNKHYCSERGNSLVSHPG